MLKPNCSFVLCRLWPINLLRFAFQCFLLKNKATQANLITEKQGVCKTKFSELRYVSISSSSSWVTQAYQQRKIKHFYSASYFNFLSHSHEQIDSGKWHYPLNRALSVENWINIEKVAPLHFALHDNTLVNKSCWLHVLKQGFNHKIDTLCAEVRVLVLG